MEQSKLRKTPVGDSGRDVQDIWKQFFFLKTQKSGWYYQAAYHVKAFTVYYQGNLLLLIRMMNDWRYWEE